MSDGTGQFRIEFPGSTALPRTLNKDRILIGRLETCDVVLDDITVSRVHAGVTFHDSHYVLANLSSSNVLTLNGRLLGTKESDVLTVGDTIQIGPFTVVVDALDERVSLSVEHSVAAPAHPVSEGTDTALPNPASQPATEDDVLKVFWEKR